MVVADAPTALACIREQLVYVVGSCHWLAASMRLHDTAMGLEAIERICATMIVTDSLITSIAREPEARGALSEAIGLRTRMLREAAPWLAAALRDVNGAEGLLHQFAASFGAGGDA